MRKLNTKCKKLIIYYRIVFVRNIVIFPLTSPEGQLIVVPVESKNWTPDYSTFDESKAISMRMEDAKGDVSMI